MRKIGLRSFESINKQHDIRSNQHIKESIKRLERRPAEANARAGNFIRVRDAERATEI